MLQIYTYNGYCIRTALCVLCVLRTLRYLFLLFFCNCNWLLSSVYLFIRFFFTAIFPLTRFCHVFFFSSALTLTLLQEICILCRRTYIVHFQSQYWFEYIQTCTYMYGARALATQNKKKTEYHAKTSIKTLNSPFLYTPIVCACVWAIFLLCVTHIRCEFIREILLNMVSACTLFSFRLCTRSTWFMTVFKLEFVQHKQYSKRTEAAAINCVSTCAWMSPSLYATRKQKEEKKTIKTKNHHWKREFISTLGWRSWRIDEILEISSCQTTRRSTCSPFVTLCLSFSLSSYAHTCTRSLPQNNSRFSLFALDSQSNKRCIRASGYRHSHKQSKTGRDSTSVTFPSSYSLLCIRIRLSCVLLCTQCKCMCWAAKSNARHPSTSLHRLRTCATDEYNLVEASFFRSVYKIKTMLKHCTAQHRHRRAKFT